MPPGAAAAPAGSLGYRPAVTTRTSAWLRSQGPRATMTGPKWASDLANVSAGVLHPSARAKSQKIGSRTQNWLSPQRCRTPLMNSQYDPP